MKRLTSVLIGLLFILSLYGQVIGKEIPLDLFGIENPEEQTIQKGRTTLNNALITGDMNKAVQLKDFLVQHANNANNVAFYPAELWRFCFLSGEYREILMSANNFNSALIVERSLPKSDELTAFLESHSTALADEVWQNITKSTIVNDEEKSFLRILLYYLAAKWDENTLDKETANFVTQFPHSNYSEFLNRYIAVGNNPKLRGNRTMIDRDKMKDEILLMSNSGMFFVDKGRLAIANALTATDYEKVKQLKDYLLNFTRNTQDVAFYPVELWRILFWTGEYNQLLNALVDFKADMNKGKNMPYNDLLAKQLGEATAFFANDLRLKISESNTINQEQKEFLDLAFSYSLYVQYQNMFQDKLNEASNTFLKHYPQSSYAPFVKKFVRVEFITEGLALSYTFGMGATFYSGQLGRYFNTAPQLQLSFDLYYKQWVALMNMNVAFPKMNYSVNMNNGLWDKDYSTENAQFQVVGGYQFYKNDRITLYPTASIGAMQIKPSDNGQVIPDIGLEFTTYYGLGAACDCRISRRQRVVRGMFPLTEQYWYLRLRYEACFPRFNRHYGNAGGNIQNITLSVGGFTQGVMRNK